MILQYLEDERYYVAHTVLRDEANLKRQEQKQQSSQMRRLRRAILGMFSWHAKGGV